MKFLWVGKSDFFRLTEFGLDLEELVENAPMFVVESNASFNSKKYAMYNNDHVFSDGVVTGANHGGVTPELMKDFVDAYFRE